MKLTVAARLGGRGACSLSMCSADYVNRDYEADMKWPLMTAAELHAFGIESILPHLANEGVTVERVNPDPALQPQIVGKRWGSLAFIIVRTACYPEKGQLTPAESASSLAWAERHQATAFFASVGVACFAYPNRTRVKSEAEMSLPIRHGGFTVAYEGLQVLVHADRVRAWPKE
jgi:hypothetical protein